MACGTEAGQHLRAGHRCDGGKARDDVGDDLPPLDQGAEGRRDVFFDCAQQHLGVHRIDDDENELPRHG